jgi:hypothetical protein
MHFLKRLAFFGIGFGIAGSSFAQMTTPTYTVVNAYTEPIYDIAMFWQAPSQGYGPGLFWAGNSPGFSVPADGTATFSDLAKPVPPTGEFLMGLVTDPATATQAAQTHLVLFMNSATAAASENIAFGTVFPHTNEDQLISDLQTISNPTANWNSALGDLFNFADGDSQHIPDGSSPTGTTTAWLTPAGNNIPTPGAVMMWSNGTNIGSFTGTNVTATPSPEGYSVFGMGLLGFVFVRRRGKSRRGSSAVNRSES